MFLFLNATLAQILAQQVNESPSAKDVIITLAGYAIALAAIGIIFYFLHRYFYKKDRERDPKSRLGKF